MDAEKRTIRFSFSSDSPVERYYGDEILDHNPSSIRLDRIRDGGPLLLEHDTEELIGVVEDVSVEGGKCYANVRFSKSEAGQAALEDVRDGIRRNVSVGYNVHKMRLESESGDRKSYRITDWEPLEVSLVSVPADSSVGIGRSKNSEENEVLIEANMEKEKETPAPAAPSQVEVNQRAITQERNRSADILKFGKEFRCEGEAADAVTKGTSFEDFREVVFARELKARRASPAPPLSEMQSEAKAKYSFIRAVSLLSENKPLDGFEGEVEKELRKHSRTAKGNVFPCEVFGVHRRTMTAGTASAGGYTVASDILGSEFIAKLDNPPVVERLGARRLAGLSGDVILVKQTGGATAYWLGEGGTVTTSDLAFGQLALTPNRLQVCLPLTKQLMVQSSMDVEAMAREDANKRLSIATDRAAFQGLGAAGEPKGLFSYDTSTSGINTITYSGAAVFAKTREAVAAIGTDNVMGSPAFVIDWASWAKWSTKAIDAGSGKFLWNGSGESGDVNGYRGIVSQHLPSSKSVTGVFSEMILAYWDGVDVIVDPYSRKKEGIVEVSATILMDIGVRYPEAFCVSTDTAAA